MQAMGMTIVEVMVVVTIEPIDLFNVFVQQAKIIYLMKFPKCISLFQKDVGDLTTVHLLYIYHFVLKKPMWRMFLFGTKINNRVLNI